MGAYTCFGCKNHDISLDESDAELKAKHATCMDPMDPNIGDIFTDYTGELVAVTARWSNQIEIESEDEVPIVYSMKRWWELVQEGSYK